MRTSEPLVDEAVATGFDGLTPSQTVGPFLALGLAGRGSELAVPAGVDNAITISGLIIDGTGAPVPDGMVETWQADPQGRFDHPDDPRGPVQRRPGWRLFGRCLTGADGSWSVTTLRPGPVPGPDGSMQAPHLTVSVFARGLLDRLVTRIYLPEDADRSGPGSHDTDPVLMAVPGGRRSALLARPHGAGYRFDIRLQGSDETVFFEV
jgi:protocatechuate 3,4-dioxygenase, alpha subunit